MKRDKGYSGSLQEADWMLTQYAMQAVEKVGLLKMDLLGLSNLTLLHKAIQQTQKITKKAIEITKIPLDDARTFELFQKHKRMASSNSSQMGFVVSWKKWSRQHLKI